MYYGEEVDVGIPLLPSPASCPVRVWTFADAHAPLQETTGKRTKQTKAEAKEARRNKLDPDSELNKSVKEIMDEQALKKRKRDQGEADSADDWSDVEGVEAELPGQGLRKKKQKMTAEEERKSAAERRKEEKKAARKERKAERKELREEEAAYERRKIKSGVNKIKLGTREVRPETKANPSKSASDETPHATNEEDDDAEDASDVEEASDVDEADADANDMTVALAQESDDDAATPSPSEPRSPVFDPDGTPADSAGQAPSTTSLSSGAGTAEKSKQHKMTSDTSALKARLAARIQSLRQERKADGPDGKPIRTRQELIESRRQKQAKQKAHKQEVRKKAKQEEDLKREEALASARNSPGGILSPAVDLADNNFAFGRVAFGDGTKLSHDLTHELSSAKKKGPSDPKTALLKVQNEKKRLQAMDEEKRKDIAEKEAWLTARKRAEGEKIRDDEKLLKKAVKRKEQGKKKSEKAWAERSEGVQKSIKARQQKRESNIKARKEQKMLGKAGKKKKPGPTKKKSRAGFEGSFGAKKK